MLGYSAGCDTWVEGHETMEHQAVAHEGLVVFALFRQLHPCGISGVCPVPGKKYYP